MDSYLKKTLQALLFATLSFPVFAQLDPLERGFLDPPNTARPRGYWCLVNGNFDLVQMTKELEEFKRMGMGAVDIWDVAGWVDENDVVPAGPPFMSDESVDAIAYAIREAGRIGLDVGLTISSSWNAGGDWVTPEDGVKGLYYSSLLVEGGVLVKRNLPFPEIPEKFGRIEMLLDKDEQGRPTSFEEVGVLAFPIVEDSILREHQVHNISRYVDGEKLRWEAPSGKWQIVRYISSGSGQPLMRPSPNSNGLMVDHFNAAAMEKNLNFFFEKLENRLGPLDQTALKYLYTDSYEANSAVWTSGFLEIFQQRMGYDLSAYLPILQGFTIGNEEQSARILHDYQRVLSDLIIENHYTLATSMCADRGIGFIAEAGGPGPPIHNVPFESLKSLGSLTVPRGEFWFDPGWEQPKIDQLQIVKGPASAAHLYNQPRVEAEAFTGTQIWQNGPGDLKETADRALCEGLTMFVYHTSPHIPREAGEPGWVYNFGTIVNTTRAWWPHAKGLHRYLGRSSYLLQQGNFVGDVLYYYGDKAPNFVLPKHIPDELGFGFDYDVTNSDIILRRLAVENGYFVLPHGQRYKVLVLPDEDRVNPDVLQRIKELVELGGVILGTKPQKAYSFADHKSRDERVRSLAGEMWPSSGKRQLGQGWVYTDDWTVREVLVDLGIKPDVSTSTDGVIVDYIHRSSEEYDIYFLRNVTDRDLTFDLRLRSVKGSPELWHPDTRARYFHPIYRQRAGLTTMPLSLEPKQSVFVVFRGRQSNVCYEQVMLDGEILFPQAGSRTLPIRLGPKSLIMGPGKYELIDADGVAQQRQIAQNTMPIKGPWELRFPFGFGTPQRVTWEVLRPWNEVENKQIRHFSGVASYHKTFEIVTAADADRILLDLGEVSKTAEVFLNGHRLETAWYAPYEVDVTDVVREGQNFLVVEVANVMSNRMTGDANRDLTEKRTHSNITRGPNAWQTPYADLRLVKSGLMGPVVLKFQTTLD